MEAIEQLINEFLRALQRADTEGILGLTDTSVVLMIPATPALRGTEALRRWLKTQFRHKSPEAEIEIIGVRLDEKLGVIEGRFTARIHDDRNTRIEVVSGNYLAVVRESEEGLRLSHCSFSSDLPPARHAAGV